MQGFVTWKVMRLLGVPSKDIKKMIPYLWVGESELQYWGDLRGYAWLGWF